MGSQCCVVSVEDELISFKYDKSVIEWKIMFVNEPFEILLSETYEGTTFLCQTACSDTTLDIYLTAAADCSFNKEIIKFFT